MQRRLLQTKQAEADQAMASIQACCGAFWWHGRNVGRIGAGNGGALFSLLPATGRAPERTHHAMCPWLQASMQVAAERRREAEQLRRQLAEDEAVLQRRRGGLAFCCWETLHTRMSHTVGQLIASHNYCSHPWVSRGCASNQQQRAWLACRRCRG